MVFGKSREKGLPEVVNKLLFRRIVRGSSCTPEVGYFFSSRRQLDFSVIIKHGDVMGLVPEEE